MKTSYLFDIAPQIESVADIKNNVKVVQGDIKFWPDVLNVVKENTVEGIFYLGMIHVPRALDAKPWDVYETIVTGTGHEIRSFVYHGDTSRVRKLVI